MLLYICLRSSRIQELHPEAIICLFSKMNKQFQFWYIRYDCLNKRGARGEYTHKAAHVIPFAVRPIVFHVTKFR
jgi:hypothetical protein